MTEPIMPADLLEAWERSYGDAPLLAHVLRERLRPRWFRVHSLPSGKRYATTDDERAELLRRQNELITDVIGDGAPCRFIFGYYDEEAQLPDDVASALRALAPEFLTTIESRDAGTVEAYPLMLASLTWEPHSLDPILLAVADDVLETPLLVSADLQRLVAPYDGGVDVIVETPERRSELARHFNRGLFRQYQRGA